jgi:TPR repeat protein
MKTVRTDVGTSSHDKKDKNSNDTFTSGHQFGSVLQLHCENIFKQYLTFFTNDDMNDNICFIIGRCHNEGIGTAINKKQALEWWNHGLMCIKM